MGRGKGGENVKVLAVEFSVTYEGKTVPEASYMLYGSKSPSRGTGRVYT